MSLYHRNRSLTESTTQCARKMDKKTQTYPSKKNSWSHRLLSSFRRRRSHHNLHQEDDIETVVKKVIA